MWDVNRTTSLMAYARQQRGFGERMRVSCETVLPINWKSFLRVDDNKTALFHFLENQISLIDVPNGKVIVTTLGENVLVNGTDLESRIRAMQSRGSRHEDVASLSTCFQPRSKKADVCCN